MRRVGLAFTLAAGLAAAAPAQADVAYSFVQTYGTPTGGFVGQPTVPLAVTLDIAFADAVVASGSLQAFASCSGSCSQDPTPTKLIDYGVTALAITAANRFSATLDDFTSIPKNSIVTWNVNLSFVPDGGLLGRILYGDGQDSVIMDFAGASLTGVFSTDIGPFPCRSTGACTFAGNLVAVPEPASLALLAVGLLGLGAAKARRRQTSARVPCHQPEGCRAAASILAA